LVMAIRFYLVRTPAWSLKIERLTAKLIEKPLSCQEKLNDWLVYSIEIASVKGVGIYL